MRPRFFSTPSAFRAWLQKNHDGATELWVGFHKKGSGTPSITWPQAVDQALCFGWIDGVRRGIDESSYAIRFTPRTSRSTWSAVNIRRAQELQRDGLMHPGGLAAFQRRTDDRSAIYSYEQRRDAELGIDYERRFRANEEAWRFFESQAPWYRRTATYWVVSAKKEETRLRRLATLISDSHEGRTVGRLTRPARGNNEGFRT
jgi:uncharacterized protein YdeI (YjbR/CyaY-like superfamily)